MLELRGVSRSFGGRPALDDVSFAARAGEVTGLLGPNGSGKTTALRVLLGLERADAGEAAVDGVPFASLDSPMTVVGALLDARAMHPGRRAVDHLRGLARTHGIGDDRIEAVLVLAGIDDVAHRRIGTFSLGMRQRLGIASMLLGDPSHLVLDEPMNGLDPDGVLWLRGMLRSWAEEGRTVLLSSHLISELALAVDHVVVLGRGRVLADAPLDAVHALVGGERVVARSDDAARLAERIGEHAHVEGDAVVVVGRDAAWVGRAARDAGAALSSLTTERPSLEAVYRHLTVGQQEFEARSS